MANKRRRQRAPAIRPVDWRRDTLTDEVNYIVGRALEHDGRVVTFGPLVLFSTPSGDAWLLDPEDHLALPLAGNGSPLPATIRETPDDFSIEWTATYEFRGDVMMVVEEPGRSRAIHGYPIPQITAALARPRLH